MRRRAKGSSKKYWIGRDCIIGDPLNVPMGDSTGAHSEMAHRKALAQRQGNVSNESSTDMPTDSHVQATPREMATLSTTHGLQKGEV